MSASITRWLLCAMIVSPLGAQSSDNGNFNGSMRVGYQLVTVSEDSAGVGESKFGQHHGLESGARLFDLTANLTPNGLLRKLADKISVEGRNLGGDPYSSMKVWLTKAGKYDFSYDRRSSAHSYDNLIRPASAGDPSYRNIGDLNRWDFERIRESAKFKMWLGNRVQLHLGYNGNRRDGSRVAAIDLAGSTIQFDRTIDDKSSELFAAVEMNFGKSTLVLEERKHQFEQLGYEPLALLSPRESEGLSHSLRFVSQPISRLTVKALMLISNTDQTFEYDEIEQIDDESVVLRTGSDEVNRQTFRGDISLSYMLKDRALLTGSVRQTSFDQTGGLDSLDRTWEQTSLRTRSGLQYRFKNGIVIVAGLQYDTRDIDLTGIFAESDPALYNYPYNSTGIGYYGTVTWVPSKGAKIVANVQSQQADMPYTTSSPTDHLRVGLKGSGTIKRRWSYRWGYKFDQYDNNDSDWESSVQKLTAGLNFTTRKFEASFAVGGSSIDRRLLQFLTGPLPDGTMLTNWPSLLIDTRYRASDISNSIDARWTPTKKFALGGTLRTHRSVGKSDSWPLSRTEIEGFVAYQITRKFNLQADARHINYEEETNGYNDYSAQIAQLSLNYAWN